MTPSVTGSPNRPRWMTAAALWCALVLAASVAGDVFRPASRQIEVWLGFEIRGWLALATAPIHYAIFATGAWAFWTHRRWVAPAACAYMLYVAVSHLVWSEASPNGRGWPIGLLQAIGISMAALLVLRAGRKGEAGAR